MENCLYLRANKKFYKRKAERELMAAVRREEIYKKLPEIKTIEEKTAGLASSMLKSVFEGTQPDDAVAEFATKLESLTEERKKILTSAGYPPDFLEIPYICKKCNDTGLYLGKQCDCYQEILSDELFSESNMGALMKKQVFGAFDLNKFRKEKKAEEPCAPREIMQKVYDFAKRYSETFEKTHENLLFYGNSGTGKTFLSSCIANRIMERGFSVVYQSAGQIFTKLEGIRFGRITSGADVLEKHIMESELLIIDDLGTEFIGKYTETELFRIVNTRILNEKSTIISTNLDPSNIKTTYSERILSRLLGHYSNFKFYGEDIRLMSVY